MTAIRRAEPSDLATVQRISADAYISAYAAVIGAVPKPASEDYEPRIARGEVWLTEQDGVTQGLVVLEPKADHLLVYSVAVAPEAQRRGLGRALLDFAGERAALLGLREVRLYTNVRMEANVRLYGSCGFVEIGRRAHPSRAGEFLVDMAKTLSRSGRT
ncbi:MAG: GNAT family N-acetyltransferase [Alphaproteobacteria bacterium]|nr:GNAT family N-acetyltransferase [Alphaproteobacteria bacterium]